MIRAIIAISLMSFSLAHADQCGVVSGDQALAGIQQIAQYPGVFEYCQDCGDTAATLVDVGQLTVQIFDVTTNVVVAVVKIGDLTAAVAAAAVVPSYTVMMDGKILDLAYVYTNIGANVGALVGCPNTSPQVLPPAIQLAASLQALIK